MTYDGPARKLSGEDIGGVIEFQITGFRPVRGNLITVSHYLTLITITVQDEEDAYNRDYVVSRDLHVRVDRVS